MLNEVLNEITINEGEFVGSQDQWLFTLAGLDISWTDIKVTAINDSIETALNSYEVPQNNGRGFLSYFKRGRQITLTVYIRGDTRELFQQNLDNFRKACFTTNAIFDDKRTGSIRRIIVNCTSSPMAFQHYNTDFLRIEVNFTSLEPFNYNTDYQSTDIFSVTASFREEISTLWTARSDVIVYIIFTTSSSTNVKLQIWNNEIEINRQFIDWDILKIDWEAKRVLVWTTEVDYNGVFPFMDSWVNFFDFTINGTFQADILILNQKNYV